MQKHNRYTFLHDIELQPAYSVWRDMVRDIHARTGCKAVFNARNKNVCFHATDNPGDMVYGLAGFRPDGQPWRREQHEIDDVVRKVMQARQDVKHREFRLQKLRQLEKWKEQEEKDRDKERFVENAKEKLDRVRKFRGMGGHFKGGAVVDGLKGASA